MTKFVAVVSFDGVSSTLNVAASERMRVLYLASSADIGAEVVVDAAGVSLSTSCVASRPRSSDCANAANAENANIPAVMDEISFFISGFFAPKQQVLRRIGQKFKRALGIFS